MNRPEWYITKTSSRENVIKGCHQNRHSNAKMLTCTHRDETRVALLVCKLFVFEMRAMGELSTLPLRDNKCFGHYHPGTLLAAVMAKTDFATTVGPVVCSHFRSDPHGVALLGSANVS